MPEGIAHQADVEARRQRAIKLFGASRSLAGTLGERFVRGAGFVGDLPPSLRFHHHVSHPDLPRWRSVPALVVSLVDARDSLRGVVRVYLDGAGGLLAGVEPVRGLGPIAGAAARLTPRASRLVVASTITAALGAVGRYPGAQVWFVPVKPERVALRPVDQVAAALVMHAGPAGAELVARLVGEGIDAQFAE